MNMIQCTKDGNKVLGRILCKRDMSFRLTNAGQNDQNRHSSVQYIILFTNRLSQLRKKIL